MKIAFLSQMGFSGKVPRNHPNARTEFAQMIALDATHHPLYDIDKIEGSYDHVVLLIPKTAQDRARLYDVDVVKKARRIGKKIWFMQEGPNWIFQDMPIHHQFWHYNVLADVDGILTENETDIPYYRGLVGKDKPIHDIPSLMITDDIVPRNEWGDAIILGGNFVRWYGGFDSYIVGKEFHPEYSLHCVSMGRKQQMEEQIEDITYTPYVQWREWIDVLSEYHVGVHLMPTIAAGTFAMNCAFHGIPCIGYNGLDTQERCHPNLSVDVGNIEHAIQLAHNLKKDTEFYDACSTQAQKGFSKYYTEYKWLENWNKQFTL